MYVSTKLLLPVSGFSTKAKEIFAERGALALLRRSIQFGYDNFLRRFLPSRIAVYNGIPVQAARLGDSYVPWHETHRPQYEETLLEAARDLVRTGDTVVIVGGGWGVSTVGVAQHVGDAGNVVTYEGSKKAVQDIRETVNLSGLSHRVSVQHAVVGENISIRHHKASHSETVLSPDELPKCDVIVLDCEGAEKQILERSSLPNRIVVETHGLFGAPTGEISDLLSMRGYDIKDRGVANTNKTEFCVENDIRVLSAIR